jgi:hypothetical protein
MTAAEAAAEETIAGEAAAEAYAAVFARERAARNLRPRNEVREAVDVKRRNSSKITRPRAVPFKRLHLA